jgi:hypothetical protein
VDEDDVLPTYFNICTAIFRAKGRRHAPHPLRAAFRRPIPRAQTTSFHPIARARRTSLELTGAAS